MEENQNVESDHHDHQINGNNNLKVQRIGTVLKQNLLSYRSNWAELNGAMGDLGTYIPIVLALTLTKNLDLGTTLIFTGLYNLVTGVIYGVPMPVQPMKSISAVAISDPEFGVPEIMAAGIWTGGILFVLGATQLMRVVYWLIPLSVVRGIQLAQGLHFAMSAVGYVHNNQNLRKLKQAGETRAWMGLDGMLLALICACFIIIVNGAGEELNLQLQLHQPQQGRDDDDIHHAETRSRELREGDRDLEGIMTTTTTTTTKANNYNNVSKTIKRIIFSLPSALIIFLLGVVLGVIRGPPKQIAKGFKLGPSHINGTIQIPWSSWKEGFIKGTIPQLPLSILNSVIAVCKLSSDLFPGDKGESVTVTSLSMTVGLMNLVGCWFGVIPTCHGAGGLAGQYKFGGRSGGCVALLGLVKLAIGLLLGGSIVSFLDRFPVGLLGVLLLFAGVELAMAARDMNTKEESFVMLITTAVSLVASAGPSLGFVCGVVTYVLLLVTRRRA